jgi:hypothetical protein
MSEMQSRETRSYTALRSALIGFAVAAFTFFPPTRTLMLWGVGAQLAVIVLRKVIERRLRDPAMAGTALMVLEIVGDGVTVALFAIATLGGIMRVEDQV